MDNVSNNDVLSGEELEKLLAELTNIVHDLEKTDDSQGEKQMVYLLEVNYANQLYMW